MEILFNNPDLLRKRIAHPYITPVTWLAVRRIDPGAFSGAGCSRSCLYCFYSLTWFAVQRRANRNVAPVTGLPVRRIDVALSRTAACGCRCRCRSRTSQLLPLLIYSQFRRRCNSLGSSFFLFFVLTRNKNQCQKKHRK